MSSAFRVIVCAMCVQERLLSSWELVWHLCEVLYLENLPPGCLVLQLLEWIKWHSTHGDQLLSQVTNVWDAHQDYWTAVRLQLGLSSSCSGHCSADMVHQACIRDLGEVYT